VAEGAGSTVGTFVIVGRLVERYVVCVQEVLEVVSGEFEDWLVEALDAVIVEKSMVITVVGLNGSWNPPDAERLDGTAIELVCGGISSVLVSVNLGTDEVGSDVEETVLPVDGAGDCVASLVDKVA